MRTLSGLATSRGFVAGPVFVYRGDDEIPLPEYVVEEGGEAAELAKFRKAIADTSKELEGIVETLKSRIGGKDDVKVFECHLMLVEDPVTKAEIERYISDERLNAAAAVRKTADRTRAQFAKMKDEYFRERMRDIDDVERRILKALTGFASSPYRELKTPSIVVADDLTPSETVQMPREYVLGFATNGGSPTSHVALLARAMGLPAVTGLGEITELVSPGETVLLDGTNGAITIAPDEATEREFRALAERQKASNLSALVGKPAGTLADGGEVLIFANVHPGVPIGGLKEHGARGIGLYRSEYLWLNRGSEPTEEEQFVAYRDAAKFVTSLSPEATITIRTLDIGGDKAVKGISIREANPFLGNRSIRYLLSNRGVYHTQLRAILRASAFGRICVMNPMISCVEEVEAAAAAIEAVKHELDREGVAYDKSIRIGAMIEVPAAALNADAIAKKVDFLSIGTNDLIQYTMAADRSNEAVAHLYQPTNPAVLKLMRYVIAAAKRNRIPVGVCGESAADPIMGVLWAAMGIDMLSMSTTYIPVMAKLFSRLTRADLAEYLAVSESAGDGASASEILDVCRKWLIKKIPDLEKLVA